MSIELNINSGTKKERYEVLLPQIKALISDEQDVIANLANISAAIWQSFKFLWVGFYRVDGDELVLGPFQGPIACTRIAKKFGVCGTAWERNETIIVENVHEFPGHIACSSESKSEIVVPIRCESGKVRLILDIDSKKLSTFDATDKKYLEDIAAMITQRLYV